MWDLESSPNDRALAKKSSEWLQPMHRIDLQSNHQVVMTTDSLEVAERIS